MGDPFQIQVPSTDGDPAELTFYCAFPHEANTWDCDLSNRLIISSSAISSTEQPYFTSFFFNISTTLIPLLSLPPFAQPGYYDWCLQEASSKIIAKGRYIVLPPHSHQHQFYEVPADLEITKRVNPNAASSTTFSLLTEMIPSLAEKGVTTVSLASSQSHSSIPFQFLHEEESLSDREDLGLRMTMGLNLSSVESSPRESSEDLFQADSGVIFGSVAELQSLIDTYHFGENVRKGWRNIRCG